MLKSIDYKKYFNSDDVLAIFVACLGHDLDHPGMNNAYLVKMADPIAIRYNDKSVLESLHSWLLFEILNSDSWNLFEGFSLARRKHIRTVIVDSILGTDMTFHFQLWDKFKAIQDFDKSDPKNRIFLASMIVHAWDLSNLLYEFDHYIRWGRRITQEFSDQYNAEETLDSTEYGDPTAMLKYTNTLGFYKSQIGFMNFIITPMWTQLYDTLKFDKVVMDNLEENKRMLNENIEKYS